MRNTFAHKIAFQALVWSAVAGLGACASSGSDTGVSGQDDQELLSEVEGGDEGSAAMQDTGSTEGDDGLSMDDTEETTTADATDTSVQSSDAQTYDSAPTYDAADNAVRAYRGSRSPKIIRTPQQKDGFWMNAFYMIRSPEENWEALSNMIYGRPDRADLLKQWNNGEALGVGTVVYYNSPARPNDTAEMKIFSEDFGYPLEQYTVKAGDSLSVIAQSRYGNPQSWKEIAAANPELGSPDVIQIGQTLLLQPTQVDTKAALDKLVAQASQSAQPGEAPADQTAVAQADQAQAQAQTAATTQSDPLNDPELDQALNNAPPAEQAEQAAQAPQTRFQKLSSSLKLSSDLVLKLGVGLLVGALAFMALRRRAAAKRAASWDQGGQTNVTKLTRPGSNV